MGDLHEADDFFQKYIGEGIQKERENADGKEGNINGLLHERGVLLSVADGEVDAAPHREADQDGGEEDHERVGAPDRGERCFAEEASDDECVDDIVELLENIAGHEGQRKKQYLFRDAALGEVEIFGHGDSLKYRISLWGGGPFDWE